MRQIKNQKDYDELLEDLETAYQMLESCSMENYKGWLETIETLEKTLEAQ